MGPETLAQVLRPLNKIFKNSVVPDLLVGLDESDDAAVYRITGDTAVIQTLDFFTPIVDDPYDFGAIAGGHTIEDPEPKYGLSVMGLAGARAFRGEYPVRVDGKINFPSVQIYSPSAWQRPTDGA